VNLDPLPASVLSWSCPHQMATITELNWPSVTNAGFFQSFDISQEERLDKGSARPRRLLQAASGRQSTAADTEVNIRRGVAILNFYNPLMKSSVLLKDDEII
jgi:hypothetical protein